MNTLGINCVIGSVFYIMTDFYHRRDGLEVDFHRIMIYEIICLMGIPIFTPNAYFLYCVLVFHTYTDECMQMAYVMPTLLAGLVESIILGINGVTYRMVVELIVGIMLVQLMAFFKAFAAGDAYYLNVLLLGAAAMGVSVLRALFVIVYAACISFVARMLIRNAVRLVRGESFQRKYAFMGSILCGYVVFIVGCVN